MIVIERLRPPAQTLGAMGMPGSGAGWDSIFYKAYIIGGIVVIVAVTLGVGLLAPRAEQTAWMPLVFGPITLWVVGILAYWWVQFLFKGYTEPERWVKEDEDDTPDIKALRSWSTLSEAMTVHGGDFDELKKLERAARRPALEWYGWTNVLTFYCLSNPWLVALGILTPQRQRYFAAGVVGLIVFIMVRTYFLLGASIGAGEYAYLRPLGLAVVERPTLDFKRIARTAVEGPWGLVRGGGIVLAGTRHDRSVQVVVDSQRNYTMVEAQVPRFTVESREGKLVPGKGAPQAVKESLKELRQAKRWVDMELQAGPERIVVERTPGRRQNMWLLRPVVGRAAAGGARGRLTRKRCQRQQSRLSPNLLRRRSSPSQQSRHGPGHPGASLRPYTRCGARPGSNPRVAGWRMLFCVAGRTT